MTPQDPISTPMVERTNRALESFDPFATPIPPPRRLDGQPVKQDTQAPLIAENVQYEAKSDVPQRSTADLEPETVEPLETKKRGRKPKALSESPAPFVQRDIIESRSPEGLPSYRCEFAGRDIFVGLSLIHI